MASEQTTQLPGWYPDPEDPDRLRRYDGTIWTGEVRPRPRFASGHGGGDGVGGDGPDSGGSGGDDEGGGEGGERAQERARPKYRQWKWLAAAAAAATVLILLGFTFVATPGAGPRVLSPGADTYIATVGADCTTTLRGLWPNFNDEPTDAQLALKTRQVADGLEALVGRMRSVPMADVDRSLLTAWLDEWSAYIADGRRFADAIEAGDLKTQRAIGSTSGRLQQRIDRFGRANGLFAAGCHLYHAPPNVQGGQQF